MRIEAVSLTLPSEKVSNEEVVNLIEKKSKGIFSGNLNSALKNISQKLRESGAKTRRWLAEQESPRKLMVQACEAALAEAKRQFPKEIDLLIYASLYPEVLEPSSASILADELNMRHCKCFDLKQGCDGWGKAAWVADALLRGGMCQRIMVVNAEFPMIPGVAIYPNLFSLSSREQLEWRFPAFTLGEGVSVTILDKSSGSDPEWKYAFSARNDRVDLCTVTPSWYGRYPFSSSRIAKDGPGLFTAYGRDLLRVGFPEILQLFRSLNVSCNEVDILLTHSSSKADWSRLADKIGLKEKYFDIFEQCGNIVSASIPGGLALAQQEGKLHRGDRVLALIASSGMSFSACYFTF